MIKKLYFKAQAAQTLKGNFRQKLKFIQKKIVW
jgi:hypothetical protein